MKNSVKHYIWILILPLLLGSMNPPPTMNITPTQLNYSLQPNQTEGQNLSIANNGDEPLQWAASIRSVPDITNVPAWLSLNNYEGTVAPFGGIESVNVLAEACDLGNDTTVYAEIIFTSTPDIGTVTIPVEMVISGDPLCRVENLEYLLINPVTGEGWIEWTFPDSCFSYLQYFVVEEDGNAIGTTTALQYETWTTIGTYNYSVYAVLIDPFGPTCQETVVVNFPNPTLELIPDSLSTSIWPDQYKQLSLTISNPDTVTLNFSFPEFDNNGFSCQHILRMHDDWGDGWNGGSLDLFLNGVLTLDDVTLAAGSGPEDIYFNAEDGDEITTVFTCGGYCYENSYEILDSQGNFIVSDGTGGANPSGIPAGQAFAICPIPSYIYNVYPASGSVPGGGSQEVAVIYNATGFPLGTYEEWLFINSNDTANLLDSIHNTMNVVIPGVISGRIKWEACDNCGIPGANARVGEYYASADLQGDYHLIVPPGTHSVNYDKLGYYDGSMNGVIVQSGDTTFVDIILDYIPYPPEWVVSTANDDNTECLVEWMLPTGPLEIVYDDSSPEDYFAHSTAENMVAVKFEPDHFPVDVYGGRLFLDIISSNPLIMYPSSTIRVLLLAADGPSGYPGTALDSVDVIVERPGWMEFEGLNYTFYGWDQDEFYLAFIMQGTPADYPEIGVDSSAQFGDISYIYDQITGIWTQVSQKNFMIRAYYEGPGQIGQTSYTVARVEVENPDLGPWGTITQIANTTSMDYTDMAWGGLPDGCYSHAVQANYANGSQSEYTYSEVINCIGMDIAVTFDIELSTGGDPAGTEIELFALNWPYFSQTTALTSGQTTTTFEDVFEGCYNLTVYKPGFDPVVSNSVCMYTDTSFHVVLPEKKYPPWNLYVDPLTSVATWNEPCVSALELEDFEDDPFPPPFWQTTSNERLGWHMTNNPGSAFWLVPTWDSYVAVDDDPGSGTTGTGSVDILITPVMDLRETDDYKLYFDSYFDGAYGTEAWVVYTTDAGENWDVAYTMTPSTDWEEIEVDLSTYAGSDGEDEIWFGFVASYIEIYGRGGWAIDNIEIKDCSDSATNPQGYHVFLNQAFVAFTEEETYTYINLQYGTTYTACVRALYTSGQSEQSCYTFTSVYLQPPRNLQETDSLHPELLQWQPPYFWDSYESMNETEIKNALDPHSEYSPTFTEQTTSSNNSRDTWDVQHTFAIATSGGEAGIETDGNYIYTTIWNENKFFKYEMNGDFIEEFTVAGCPGQIRDMAFDGTYMYGSNASTTVYRMDFSSYTTVSTFTAPVAVRAIAYDDGWDAFWANNWSGDITCFDMTGAQINSIPDGGYTSMYGFAYDNWSNGGPYLWGFDQGGSGAQLVKYDIASGAVLQTVNVLAIVGGSQIAGGLYTHCGNYEVNKVTIGGVLQNEMVFALELAYCQGGVATTGLIGFNMYRDWHETDSIPYNGEDTLYWSDIELDPGPYEYSVTAVYDLETYGFPGQTGESMHEGPVVVMVSYGSTIPWGENWDSGSFTTNEWTTQCNNWSVTIDEGNPPPTTQFNANPLIQEPYSCGLISFPIKGTDEFDGEVYLDFDLKLDDNNSRSSNESMIVRLWEYGIWHTIDTVFSSSSFDWTHHSYNIDSLANGIDFKIGFFAEGENSADIYSWYIDNILVYQNCPGPIDLEATVDDPGNGIIRLDWSAIDTNNQWEFSGYNIYRAHEDSLEFYMLNKDPVLDTVYLDTIPNEASYCYYVNAVYNNCVSANTEIECAYNYWVNQEELLDYSIKVYPNPATDRVYVESSHPIEEIEILNLNGQSLRKAEGRSMKAEVRRQKAEGGAGLDRTANHDPTLMEVNLIGLKNGVYLLKVYSDDRVEVRRIIVMN